MADRERTRRGDQVFVHGWSSEDVSGSIRRARIPDISRDVKERPRHHFQPMTIATIPRTPMAALKAISAIAPNSPWVKAITKESIAETIASIVENL
ncbi:MAG: hypothetical protein OXC91_14570 [Rhodobacteraceae bacterium]|nr:hypothetical protein [Paracoccaceae bacterium]